MISREITDAMINRAVELWCRKLFTPKFDNGDNSDAGFMCKMLATINIQDAKDATENLSDKVEVFRASLTKALIKSRDDEIKGDDHFNGWLDVDYNPCEILLNAANEAEIPEELFSVKTSISIRNGFIAESSGYAAETFFHYQLPDGRWLITSLNGSDISKIKEQIMNGNDLGLNVENLNDKE